VHYGGVWHAKIMESELQASITQVIMTVSSSRARTAVCRHATFSVPGAFH
jgi:hypothetical protein